jgi:hypothetical protein
MMREIYISYDRLSDIWRAHVFLQKVRALFRPRINMAIADWEDRERAVAEIHTCLTNTVTTIILIGSETAQRPWVRHEIEQSIARGNSLLGIYIHQMQDHNGDISHRGLKPNIPDGIDFPAYDWDLDKTRFWKEVKTSARRAVVPRKKLYFATLGW